MEFRGRGAAPAHPGRHRRGGAESWTPPLPPHRPVRHHAAGQAPAATPISGTHPFPRYGAGPAPAATPLPGTPAFPHYPAVPAPAETPMFESHPLWRSGAGQPPAQTPVSGSPPLPHATAGRPPAETPMSGCRPFPHHTAGPAPADPPMSGLLPLPQPSLPRPSLPQPRDRRPAPPLFPASHGSLPLDAFDDVEHDDLERDDLDGNCFDDDLESAPATESRADQAARRTRVSLAAPAPRGVDLDEDDVRIYSAPPIDGLGGFTIGSVPASVTPPKTWRKAAWFATGASGAVVVGLLCAGSFLVGKPPVDQAVQGAWPGYQGAPAVAEPTGELRPPTEGGSAAGPESASRPENAGEKTRGGGGAGPVDGVAPPPGGRTAAPETAATGPAAPADQGASPQKPPVTPAQRETPVKPPWWYSFPPDAQTMGDNSEQFFNTVTTDPSAASSVTTGRLHDQGPQALAERYAGIAYFEVKKVSIDQQRGVTINTVEVTHTDGTKTIEERTLTFGDGDKITADGQ